MTTTLEKSIEIAVPIHDAYQLWTEFSRYPDFMAHVREVNQKDPTRLQWRGVVGDREVSWDTEIIEQTPGQSLSWQTLKGTRSTTSIRLATLDDGRTAITYTVHYPNGVGKSGNAADIAQQCEQVLQRFADTLAGTPHAAAAAPRGRPQPTTEDTSMKQPTQETSKDTRTKPAAQDPSPSASDPSVTAQPKQDPAQQAQQDSQEGQGADVLGPGYSFQSSQEWREQQRSDGQGQGDGGADPSRLLNSTFSRGIEALMAFSPMSLTLHRARNPAAPNAWFSSMFSALEEPFNAMKRLSEELDREMETFLWGAPGTKRRSLAAQAAPAWTPSVDVKQTGDKVKVTADLPGISKDDVEVEFRDGQLVISGERRAETTREENGVHLTERTCGRFVRAVPLPEGVDSHGAQAKMQDGVLEVTLAAPAARQRRIQIEGGEQRA